MTPERWQEIKRLLGQALDAPSAERVALVEEECAHDPELCTEVLSLLAAADGGGTLATGGLAAVRDSALHAILATALGQQYEIVRPLGRGGMGAVYLARERALDRFVAIKMLRPDLAAFPDGRERFKREACVAAQLSHPSILPLHTFGEVNGIWFFVMGYVRGVSLAERLRVEGRISDDEAYRILIELAEALECAHRHDVVHRDIKPANILLDDESGRAMLADFGIAKVQGAGDSLTLTGAIVGTPHYMSPEQSLGESTVDSRSDVYSLGAVGYKMISGREPYEGVPAEKLIYHRLAFDPPPLPSVAPSVSPELAEVIARCMTREPAGRWQTARSLRDALTRAAGDAAAALPESLRDLPTFGPYALLWASAWTALAAFGSRASGDRVLLLLIAVIVPVGFTMHIWNTGQRGLGTLGLARVAFWPPEWWGMWWPLALRRPTDLWPRLPWIARAVRIVLSAFLVTLPTLILLRDAIEQGVPTTGPLEDGWFASVETALVLGTAVTTVAGLLWAYALRLSWPETVRILFGATAPSPGWTTPAMVRFLAPAGPAKSRVRDTPTDHRRAILELVGQLPPSAAEVGAASAAAAGHLLSEIESCDAELEQLGRDASGTELERLIARLGSLDAGPSSEITDHRQLVDLVRAQVEVVRRMQVRCEFVSQRRARLYNLMRGLWRQLCLVRDSLDDATAIGPKLVSRLRELCAEIADEVREEVAGEPSRRAVADGRLAHRAAETARL